MRILKPVATCLSVLLLAACAKTTSQGTASQGDTEARIRELEQQQVAFAMAGDREGLLRIFAPHFRMISPVGSVATRDELLGILAGSRPYSAATYATGTVRVYTDVVVTTGTEDVEYGPGAQAGQKQQRRVTQVWERNGDDWWLASRHATLVTAP